MIHFRSSKNLLNSYSYLHLIYLFFLSFSLYSGESVWQSFSLSICWRDQHSSAVAAQQLGLQLTRKTRYKITDQSIENECLMLNYI